MTATSYGSIEKIHEMIRTNSGTIVTYVSRKTDIIITGAKAGLKINKSADLGIDVWTESNLKEPIGFT